MTSVTETKLHDGTVVRGSRYRTGVYDTTEEAVEAIATAIANETGRMLRIPEATVVSETKRSVTFRLPDRPYTITKLYSIRRHRV